MSIFDRIELDINHGTEKGIVPRFYRQIREIAQIAFLNKEDFDSKMLSLYKENLKDFTSFYDLFEEIESIHLDYNKGVKNGEYFFRDKQGVKNLDRTKEVILNRKIKEFFVEGKQVINNLSKTGVVKDETFDLFNFLFVKETNFHKAKNNYIANNSNGIHIRLIEYIEQSRKDFLTLYLSIRDKFEHHNFRIDEYIVDLDAKNELIVSEPKIENYNSFSLVKGMYNNILYFCEGILVLFYGAIAVSKTNGFFGLYRKKIFDLKQLNCEYLVLPRHHDENLQLFF